MKSKRFMLRMLPLVAALAAVIAINGCAPTESNGGNGAIKGAGRIQWVHFTDPLAPQTSNPPIHLRSARNETISFAIQINSLGELSSRRGPTLRLVPFANIAARTSAWQIVPMPVDTNRAGFARHTGLAV